jgi:hypothetical protein
MKNLRNKNQPPNADLVQRYLESSWDIVYAVYLALQTGELAKDSESKSIIVENPTGSEDLSFFFTDVPITITQIRAVLVGSGGPSVTWTIRHDTDRSAAGVEVVTGGTVTTDGTVGSDITTFDDPTIAADSHIWLETTAQAGTVNQIIITVFYDED